MSFHRRTYALRFTDPSWNGFEVRAKGLTIEESVEYEGLIFGGASVLADPERLTRFYEITSKFLVSWNLLDDNDDPVPTDVDHLRKEEASMIFAIAKAWIGAAVSVPPPLSESSTSGDPSQEEFDLTAALSESQSS